MNYLEEARAMITNGIVAYGQHFELLREEDVDSDLLEVISGVLESLEALMPVLISMYEMTKKLSGNQDLTFLDWLEEVAGKMGGKDFNLF
jgi:hypothetical protein